MISTGMVVPFISLVRSLNCITNWPMFTPCWPSAGPTGGAGVAWPPGHWSFTFAVITFAIVRSLSIASRVRHRRMPMPARCRPASASDGSDPLHLPVFQVDRRRPVEDDQHDLDQAAGLDDFLDGPLEVLERAVLDLDAVAALDVDPDLGSASRSLAVCWPSIWLTSSSVILVGVPWAPTKSPTPGVSRTVNQVFSFSSISTMM